MRGAGPGSAPAAATATTRPAAADFAAALEAAIATRTARVVVVGQGNVGLPVALRAVEQGFPVVGLEASAERVAALAHGRSYVLGVSDAQVCSALAAGFRPLCDPGAVGPFDVAVVSVPTPLTDGVPDLAHVVAAVSALAAQVRPGALVVLESTTYPGTTEELVRPLLESSGLRSGEDLFVGYSPERIDPGNERWGFVNTPKVVAGVDPRSRRVVEAFYASLVDRVVPVASTAEAELVKLIENTFRTVNIALVNELAVFAAELGIDVWQAIEAATTKPFGYMPFRPGPGVGGHCLPIDPSYLSWRVQTRLGRPFRFVELANEVNGAMPGYVVGRLGALLHCSGRRLRGSRILALGLSYKAGSPDWRGSPAVEVVRRLVGLGAEVRAAEPHIPAAAAVGALPPHLQAPAPVVDCTIGEIVAADAVVILVDHADFPLDAVAEHAKLVLDTKGCLRDHAFRGETL